MLALLLERREERRDEQLLKLYWNRAGVKRELSNLKRERFELLDKLKEQEGEITRAQEQLEGLERLLANPVAAANAMVYFQLRHLWRMAASRLEQFATELRLQRERRERAQFHAAAAAKRKRRLDAVSAKLTGLLERRKGMLEECAGLEKKLESMHAILRLFRGPKLRRDIHALQVLRVTYDERARELSELAEGIEAEALPEPEGLSLESHRTINVAILALAQHLVLHFSEHDLASLAKTASEQPVADMTFGDRRTCDAMVERIRERIEKLEAQKTLGDLVKKRADHLMRKTKYSADSDVLPEQECVERIEALVEPNASDAFPQVNEGSLKVNVLEHNYWDVRSILH